MPEPNNPFKGPQSYSEADELYGRSKEIEDLYRLIENENLTLLFSRSGTGKSSLIKAGLIPYFKNLQLYVPIFIHLNDIGINASIATSLSDFVIRRCKEEISKYATDKDLKLIYPEITNQNSIFEFILGLQLILEIENDDGEIENDDLKSKKAELKQQYTVKPLLIFDQLEEIFTLPFHKTELNFLLNELSCLIDSQVPQYLSESFSDSREAYFLRLKNNLLSKQKTFRILFSFREEFLPQFESLRNEIPSVRFTNSRYRLEPFSIETASEIITQTDPDISSPSPRLIAEALSVNILNNFDRVIVEPFLLSTVCQIIYPELIGLNNSAKRDTRIKQLVNGAIEQYINRVYKSINEDSQEFIETKLITSDNKRTPFNYNDVIKNPRIKGDIDSLLGDKELRLLNIEQFLDSYHVNILHDRLLPPIAIRRDKRIARRTEEAERAATLAKTRELEKANKEEQLKLQQENDLRKIELERAAALKQLELQKRKQTVTFLTVVVLLVLFIGGYYYRVRVQTTQAALESAAQKARLAALNQADSLKTLRQSAFLSKINNRRIFDSIQQLNQLNKVQQQAKLEAIQQQAKLAAVQQQTKDDKLSLQAADEYKKQEAVSAGIQNALKSERAHQDSALKMSTSRDYANTSIGLLGNTAKRSAAAAAYNIRPKPGKDSVFYDPLIYKSLAMSILDSLRHTIIIKKMTGRQTLKNGQYSYLNGVLPVPDGYYLNSPFISVFDQHGADIFHDTSTVKSWVSPSAEIVVAEAFHSNKNGKFFNRLVVVERKNGVNININQIDLDINQDVASLVFNPVNNSCIYSTRFPSTVKTLNLTKNAPAVTIQGLPKFGKNEYIFLTTKGVKGFIGVSTAGQYITWEDYNNTSHFSSQKINLKGETISAVTYTNWKGGRMFIGLENGKTDTLNAQNNLGLFENVNYRNRITALESSPDSRWLASSSGSLLKLWKLDSKDLTPVDLPLISAISSMKFFPERNQLVIATNLGSVYVLPLSTRELAKKICTDDIYYKTETDWIKYMPSTIKFQPVCIR